MTMGQDIAIFEGDRAKNYDTFVKSWIPNYDYFIGLLTHLIPKSAQNILVVGCGSGNEVLAITKSNPELKITGVDPSPEMIELAKNKLSSYSGIKLFEGFTEDLPKEKLYDVATLSLVLHFIEDNGGKLQQLKQIAERLNLDSPLIILDIFGSESELKQNLDILSAFLPQHISDEEIAERRNRIKKNIHHITEERLSEILQLAGFTKPLRFHQAAIYGGWITKKL